MLRTAVIIAGGEAARLRPLTDAKPKTLVEVYGKPILYWVLTWLKKYNITHVVIGVAYKKEKIYEFMSANNNFGLDVDFSEHTVEGGTAQAFRLAIERFVKDEDFVAMNADEITNMNLQTMVETHISSRDTIVTMATAPLHCRFGIVRYGDGNKIERFKHGEKIEDIPVSTGLYIFNRKILDYIPCEGSIEEDVFAKLAADGRKILGYRLPKNEEWVTINTLKDIKDAETSTVWSNLKE